MCHPVEMIGGGTMSHLREALRAGRWLVAPALAAAIAWGPVVAAAPESLPQVDDAQLQSHSATALGNELLRRNASTRDILAVRELTSKYLGGGADKDFSPQLQVAVAPAPSLLGPGSVCRSLRLRLDPAFPSNYLPAVVIDGPWCLTRLGWEAMTLQVSGAFPKPFSEVPRPWDNHGLETTTLVITPLPG